MTDEIKKKLESRPEFPKRAVITGGMPYGNKELHFAHIGGCLLHADAFARFLRCRIGRDNVIFVSGTDCYGSPITESHRKLDSDMSIEDFVSQNHEKQKKTIADYDLEIDLFAASALGHEAKIHNEMSQWFIKALYDSGYLETESTLQFYDTEFNTFLNGRQVTGRCPIQGCRSESAYADECGLGHQYQPSELINPISSLSGKKPEMREAVNWYFKLQDFHEELTAWLDCFKKLPQTRAFSSSTIEEFLAPPVIYLKRDYLELLDNLELPDYEIRDEKQSKTSIALVFKKLSEREKACEILSGNGINFRTGKTLVPFRITGNAEWGVPAPVIEGREGLTVWVWPESLWAPISFTMSLLEKRGRDAVEWKDWWCGEDSEIYQFIGQDNLYFYGPAEMAMFMAVNTDKDMADKKLKMPHIVANNHLILFGKKASSSGAVKPIMADEMLKFYTTEQLRAHYLSLGLGIRSVDFKPKAFAPDKDTNPEPDPVLKEGNLLTNVLNRVARSCFYTAQKYTDSRIPDISPSNEAADTALEAALDYESLMFRCEFHLVMSLLDSYIRGINKLWVKNMRIADDSGDNALRMQTLADCFYMLRVAAVLTYPVAPYGSALLASYFNLDCDFFSWEHIFEPLTSLVSDTNTHKLKFLEPRFDFFKKHESQVN